MFKTKRMFTPHIFASIFLGVSSLKGSSSSTKNSLSVGNHGRGRSRKQDSKSESPCPGSDVTMDICFSDEDEDMNVDFDMDIDTDDDVSNGDGGGDSGRSATMNQKISQSKDECAADVEETDEMMDVVKTNKEKGGNPLNSMDGGVSEGKINGTRGKLKCHMIREMWAQLCTSHVVAKMILAGMVG